MKHEPKHTVGSLPEGVEHISFRSDSAGYQHDMMQWCNEKVSSRTRVAFAIRGDMSPQFPWGVETVEEIQWRKHPGITAMRESAGALVIEEEGTAYRLKTS